MEEKDRSSECMALKLSHSNIIRYKSYGVIFRKKLFFHVFVMEKMDFSLADYLTKNQEWTSFPVARRRSLFDRICKTVEFLHKERVKHLDLKPANFLLKSDGKGDFDLNNFKLTDFGFSQNHELATTKRGTPGRVVIFTIKKVFFGSSYLKIIS